MMVCRVLLLQIYMLRVVAWSFAHQVLQQYTRINIFTCKNKVYLINIHGVSDRLRAANFCKMVPMYL